MLKYAILSVSLITVMAGAMIAPAVAAIAAAFPEATPLQINVLTSLHAGMVVPFAFVSGYLVRYYSKKSILLVSLVLYLIGGVGGALSPDIWFMLATRAVLGVAVGLMIPISITLISDNYVGEERTATLGLQSAATNLGGIIAIVVSGVLATQGWQYSFMSYGMGAIIFFIVLFMIPNKKPAPYVKESVNNKLDPRVWLLAFYMVLTFVVFFGIPSNMALFLKELDVTNTITNGIIIATCSVGGFLGGLSLAFFRRKFKSFFVPFQVSFMAIGFVLIAFVNESLFSMGLGVLILGFGYGSTVPVIFDSATRITTGTATSTATALLVSAIYTGQFLSPVLLGFVSRTFGDGSVYFSYTMMALALVFVAAMLLSERFLHFTGIKGWLTRSNTKLLITEISHQQTDLKDSIDSLAERLDTLQQGRNPEADDQVAKLSRMVQELNTRLESLTDQRDQQPGNSRV